MDIFKFFLHQAAFGTALSNGSNKFQQPVNDVTGIATFMDDRNICVVVINFCDVYDDSVMLVPGPLVDQMVPWVDVIDLVNEHLSNTFPQTNFLGFGLFYKLDGIQFSYVVFAEFLNLAFGRLLVVCRFIGIFSLFCIMIILVFRRPFNARFDNLHFSFKY